jgi:uncharacterized protein YifE (UPF0438 family)
MRLTLYRNFNFEPETSQEQSVIKAVIRNEKLHSMRRINPWNKYRLLQPQYDGLMDLEGRTVREGFDSQYEYGLTLVDIDSDDNEMQQEVHRVVS